MSVYVRIQGPAGEPHFGGICDGSLTIKNRELYGDPSELTLELWDNGFEVLDRYTDLKGVDTVKLIVHLKGAP